MQRTASPKLFTFRGSLSTKGFRGIKWNFAERGFIDLWGGCIEKKNHSQGDRFFSNGLFPWAYGCPSYSSL